MAREFFCSYHSYLKSIEPLNEAECGRLWKACMEYSSTGIEPELRGNERFVWPTIREQIDRDAAKYDAFCEKQRENIRKRWDTNVYGGKSGIPSYTKNTNEKEKEKEKKKETLPPYIPPQGDTGFGDELQSAFEAWIRYKIEKRQPYKPTGLKSLITEIRSNAAKHGEMAVADLINQCMASNWQGIIFDRLKAPANQRIRGAKRDPLERQSATMDDFERMKRYLEEEAGSV